MNERKYEQIEINKKNRCPSSATVIAMDLLHSLLPPKIDPYKACMVCLAGNCEGVIIIHTFVICYPPIFDELNK